MIVTVTNNVLGTLVVIHQINIRDSNLTQINASSMNTTSCYGSITRTMVHIKVMYNNYNIGDMTTTGNQKEQSFQSNPLNAGPPTAQSNVTDNIQYKQLKRILDKSYF